MAAKNTKQSDTIIPKDNKVKYKNTKKNNKQIFIPRVLCFTNIDTSKIEPYTFLENISNQSYKNIYFIYNIFIESKEEENFYKKILKHLINPTTIKINFLLKKINNPSDHLISFSNFEHQIYNMFIYIDSSGIYMPNYIDNLIKQYSPDHDIVHIPLNKYGDTDKDNRKNNKYNYILNNKSLDILLKNKSLIDNSASIVHEHKLQVKEIKDNRDAFIIKQTEAVITNNEINSSSSNNNYYQFIDNEFFTICIFEHNFWSSFVYLNKRNNRMYNIYNDDHGAFSIKDEDSIIINWDTWGEEIFYKHYIDNKYYYSINK